MAVDREKILQTAQKYIDKKKYDRAIAEYQRIVQHDPNDARTLLKVGDLQARMEAYAEAIATYDRVGQYYAAQGFALKAIAVYKQIRELIQKHAPALGDRYGHIVPKLAEIYTQLGLTSDALAAYDEVATRFQRAGRDRDAIDVFRRMVELDASNPLPHLRLAEACCRVQGLDEAIDSFWAAAELLMKLNRRDDALKVLERILHFRQDPKYAKLAAQLYLQSGTHQDGLHALAKLQVSFQADPKDLDTLSLLGSAFNVIGQETKGVEVYKEMARLAREQQQGELYRQVMEHLLAVAPEDEQVRALANIGPASAYPPPDQSVETEDAVISVSGELMDADDAGIFLENSNQEPAQLAEYPTEAATAARGPLTSAPDVVVVDEGLEAAEELGAADSFDARAHARKAIVDAESFRKLRLYSKATETLQIALEIDPRSIQIREKLRDVLTESGDADAAIGESITMAAIYIDAGQAEAAESELYRVLESEPEHPTAMQMLQDLGVVVAPSEADYAQEAVTADAGREQLSSMIDEYPSTTDLEAAPRGRDYDPNAPLPSYDLEEVGAAAAMGSGEHAAVNPGAVQAAPESGAFDAVDDPFSEPLPSFPLGAESETDRGVDASSPMPPGDQLIEDLDPGPSQTHESLPEFEDELEEASLTDLDAVEESAGGVEPVPVAPPVGVDTSAVEEVLEEAEFFAARGLHDDAKMILEDQLARTPGHPLLIERLREIQETVGGAPGESGAREVSQAPASGAPGSDRAFDIAASLDALDEFDDVTSPDGDAGARPTFASEAGEIDVDQVFAKFKEGVQQQVAEGDSSTHYDLGVAYKEMGLLPDAIAEFEVAAKDPARECMCFAMVGLIHLEQNDLEKAADAFIRGLHAGQKTVEQEMSLYYDLGNVYEMQGNTEEALYYFQKIARRDPGYRDVKDRIATLQPQSQDKSTSRPIGEDDEFDKVFDELFDTKSS